MNWCRLCSKKYRQENKEKLKVSQQAYRDANRERVREWDRRGSRAKTLRQYGLTEESFEAMKEAQGHGCAICGRGDDLVVDHNHDTGQVRALLCRGHNAALGQFGDDPQLLRSAARYLELHDLSDKGRPTGEESP